MNKSMLLTGLIAAALQIQSAAAVDCPAKVLLKNAAFIGGEEFPTEQQLKTNFNHSFVVGNTTTWEQDDLSHAESFVELLRENYNETTKTVTLTLHPIDSERCGGRLGPLAFAYTEAGLIFVLDDFQRDTVTIPYPDPGQTFNHAAVEMNIALPSNCSNCIRDAELFEFRQVETHSQP